MKLDVDDLITINRTICEGSGEPFLLRDRSLLESAWASPRNLQVFGGVNDPVRLAVHLALAIGRNHPFLQGNKRTAFDAMIIELELLGLTVNVPDVEPVADLFIAAIQGAVHEEDMALQVLSWIQFD